MSMRRRGVNNEGKKDPVRVSWRFHRQVPAGRGDRLVPGPVAVRPTGIGALVPVGANVLGRLSVDPGLQDRVQQLLIN
jgi:hypothetical protein